MNNNNTVSIPLDNPNIAYLMGQIQTYQSASNRYQDIESMQDHILYPEMDRLFYAHRTQWDEANSRTAGPFRAKAKREGVHISLLEPHGRVQKPNVPLQAARASGIIFALAGVHAMEGTSRLLFPHPIHQREYLMVTMGSAINSLVAQLNAEIDTVKRMYPNVGLSYKNYIIHTDTEKPIIIINQDDARVQG